jgi:predicted metal-binding membrane protein
MMLPLLVAPVRATAARSFWERRHRSIAGFLLGYVAAWGGFGIFATWLLAAAAWAPSPRQGIAAGAVFVAGALWRLTSAGRRARLGCHRSVPLYPRGWRADRDCLRFGWMIAVPCMGSCWALMLGCLLAGHALPVMAGATLAAGAERYAAPREQALVGPLLLMLAAFAALS